MRGNEPTDSDEDERQLQELAAAILDGAPIDWAAASARLPADVVEELRALAAVTDLHRDMPEKGVAASPSTAAGTLGEWGHLQLLERIASGSFGEVFRAWDSRLDRQVALKLLYRGSPGTVEESAVIAEGRLLARVRHPNVVIVYGAERIDDRVGIWTEYIDGVTLAVMIDRDGPLPVDRVVEVGVDLCRALGALHDAGVVHGDVKAQNVLQEEATGRIVLVDLGTGREHATDAAVAAAHISGTPLYMAPELWKGAHPTVATDLYSAGVLLHYLATGTFPVAGSTTDQVRAAHERGDRTWLSRVRPDLPAWFSAVVDAATSIDPSSRPTTVRAMEATLEQYRRAPARRRRLTQFAAMLTALAAVSALSVYALRTPRSYPPDVAPAAIARPAVRTRQVTFHSPEVTVGATAANRDGTLLAYKASNGLYVRSLANDDAPRQLDWPADRDVSDLAWLPSNALLVTGRDGLWRLEISGAAPVRLMDGAQTVNVSHDGSRLALHRAPEGIWLATLDGAQVGDVVAPRPQTRFGEPTWSPDDGRIAYTTYTQTPQGQRVTIETRRIDGSGATTVFEGGLSGGTGVHHVRWHRDGRLLFTRPFPPPRGRFTNWWALSVDAATGEPVGEPRPITDWPDFNFGSPTITDDGRVVALRTRAQLNVYWATLGDAPTGLRDLRRLVLDTADAQPSAWTPAGDGVLFWSWSKIFEQRTDGSAARELVARPGGEAVHADYSPDGQFLLYIFEEFPKPDALMRRRISGGPDEKLLDLAAASSWVRCTRPPVHVCMASEVVDGRLRLVPFDPATGEAGRRLELPTPPSPRNGWDISPDGSELVSLDVGGGGGRLLITSRSTAQTRHFSSDMWRQAQTIAWHPRGDGWVVTLGDGMSGRVLHVDRAGRSTVIWSSPYQRLWNPTIAPDGRAIAFASWMSETSIWLVEGL